MQINSVHDNNKYIDMQKLKRCMSDREQQQNDRGLCLPLIRAIPSAALSEHALMVSQGRE